MFDDGIGLVVCDKIALHTIKTCQQFGGKDAQKVHQVAKKK